MQRALLSRLLCLGCLASPAVAQDMTGMDRQRDRLMLRALRDSKGGAVAVEESEIEPAAAELRTREGIDAGPEGGAALLALRRLIEKGAISSAETVVLFNTGGNKYHS